MMRDMRDVLTFLFKNKLGKAFVRHKDHGKNKKCYRKVEEEREKERGGLKMASMRKNICSV